MIIAFYLPQFHPIPENDDWWGRGFTEWINVANAKPLFKGHNQPRIPGELGFYDLRISEVLDLQTSLANEYNIDGFCFYHYWFNGKLLLQKPVENILESRNPDLKYCLCWANENWTANWVGNPNKVLLPQTYSGIDDHVAHIKYLAPFFEDERYIRIENKPVFLFHKPLGFVETSNNIPIFQSLAKKYIGKPLYLIGVGNNPDEILSAGFDGVVTYSLKSALSDYLVGIHKIRQKFQHSILRMPRWVIPYRDLVPYMIRKEWKNPKVFPDVLPNWDNTPRLGSRGLVLTGSNPHHFKKVLTAAKYIISEKDEDKRIIFLKSWNEWAEGNYVEPDSLHGRGYLEVISSVMGV